MLGMEWTEKILLLLFSLIISLLTAMLRLYVRDLRQLTRRVDEHLDSCGLRNSHVDKTDAAMTERVNSLTWEIQHIRKMMHWVGDCLMILGSKVDIHLPSRPPTE